MTLNVAVVGASGFVGSTLTERLAGSDEFTVTPFIHRSGAAARLARRGTQPQMLDVLDRDAVRRTLAPFEAVVNCSRGGAEVMLAGLENLLRACRDGAASRFVHISSVAVYGDPPHPASTVEGAPAEPVAGSYGALKLQQDRMVDAAANGKLQTAILCPPNITGPYSGYVTDIINSIESGRFRLLDEGQWAVNVVDVRNLAEAVVCAMRADTLGRGRYFVGDDAPFNWADLCTELAPVCRAGLPVASMSSAHFLAEHAAMANAGPRVARSALKHLTSDEVRAALRMNKRLAAAERGFRGLVRHLGKPIENRMQRAVAGPIHVPKAALSAPVDVALVSQQLRKVKHGSTRAREELHYQPPYSLADSFADFRAWYSAYCGIGTPEWALLVNH